MIQNEVLHNIQTRRSCRAYLPQQITEEELQTVLEAGTWAPTGRGLQSPVIVAVQNAEDIATLSRLNAAVMHSNSDPFYGAPTVLVVLADSNNSNCVPDGSLVMGNLMLAAHSIGLGSCWINRAREVFATEEGKALLHKWNVPHADDLIGVGNCIVGYAAPGGTRTPAPRKDDYIVMVR